MPAWSSSVGILGYYVLISMTLNVFRMPLPEGEALPFKEPAVKSNLAAHSRAGGMIQQVSTGFRGAFQRADDVGSA